MYICRFYSLFYWVMWTTRACTKAWTRKPWTLHHRNSRNSEGLPSFWPCAGRAWGMLSGMLGVAWCRMGKTTLDHPPNRRKWRWYMLFHVISKWLVYGIVLPALWCCHATWDVSAKLQINKTRFMLISPSKIAWSWSRPILWQTCLTR